VTRLHSIASDRYMTVQNILGDNVFAAASAIPADKVTDLIASRYQHSVAMGTRFYNLMSVASGHSGRAKFQRMSLSPDHISNALAKAGPDNIAGAAQSLVLSGGRDIITQTAEIDPLCDGCDWETEPGACDYCLSQAGPIEGTFRAHYNCGCIAVPRFSKGK
jgi:hypothetical protein